jgi:outer membrane protein assembly factor BamB
MESWYVRPDGAATNRYVDHFDADHRFDVGGAIEEIWAGELGSMHGGSAVVAAVFRAPDGTRRTALERVHSFTLVTQWKTTLPFAVRAPVHYGHSLYASGDGHVVKLDSATGAVVWRKPASAALGPPRVGRRKLVFPVVAEGALPAGFPAEVVVDERSGSVLTRLPR